MVQNAKITSRYLKSISAKDITPKKKSFLEQNPVELSKTLFIIVKP